MIRRSEAPTTGIAEYSLRYEFQGQSLSTIASADGAFELLLVMPIERFCCAHLCHRPILDCP